MITRKQKEKIVKDFGEKFEKAKIAVFTDFTGAKNQDLENLRSQLKEKDINYYVIKKNLLKRIYPKFDYNGPVAVALADDEISVSKILYNFPKVKIISSRDLDLTTIEELAKMLSREDLLIKFIYLLKSNLNKLILCLKQKAQKQILLK